MLTYEPTPQEIVGKKTQKKSPTEKTRQKNPDKKNPEIFLHVYLGVGRWADRCTCVLVHPQP